MLTDYAYLTDERINVIDNRIRFMSFLQTLKANIGCFEAEELFLKTKETSKIKWITSENV